MAHKDEYGNEKIGKRFFYGIMSGWIEESLLKSSAKLGNVLATYLQLVDNSYNRGISLSDEKE